MTSVDPRMDRRAGVRRRAWGGTSVALALAVTLAGCAGGTEEDSGEDTQVAASSDYAFAGTADDTAAAAEAGRSAAGPATTKPEGKKIAYVHFNGQSTSSQRVGAGVRGAAEALGYEYVECDPLGDPQKVKECATAMVAQQPDLIVSYYQEAISLGSAVDDAGRAGIPWVALDAPVTPNPGIIQYVTPTLDIQNKVDEAVVETVQSEHAGETAKVFGMAFPQGGENGIAQKESFAAAIEGAEGLELVGMHDLDGTNIQQDTISAVKQSLTQHPDLAAIWTVCDLCVPLVRQATAGSEAEPLIFGSFSTPASIADIRSGSVRGVVDIAHEAFGWITLDRALEHWQSGQPMSTEPVTGAYPLPFGEPYMITTENAGEGDLPIFGPDFQTFFTEKWAAEFGQN
jgi:ABC-type sugar transport system substrate-binding protein